MRLVHSHGGQAKARAEVSRAGRRAGRACRKEKRGARVKVSTETLLTLCPARNPLLALVAPEG